MIRKMTDKEEHNDSSSEIKKEVCAKGDGNEGYSSNKTENQITVEE